MHTSKFTRHLDLWFDDGSVILVAQITGFRVHRGLLARHSEIFNDMFSMPQPAEVETFEGCQVVCLSDNAADVATILGILYDCGQQFYSGAQEIEFRVIVAALELGTKYAFDAMRREALRRMSHCYPRDIETTMIPEGEHCAHWGHRASAGCSIIWQRTDPILVFRLARRLGLDDFIPMALYRCANSDLSLSELFSTVVEQDGRPPILSIQELADCVQAREYLSVQQSAMYEKFATGGLSPDCLTRVPITHGVSHCQNIAESCAAYALGEQYMTHRDVFWPMSSWIEENGQDLCKRCEMHYKKSILSQQKRAWAYLRERFGSASAKQQEPGTATDAEETD